VQPKAGSWFWRRIGLLAILLYPLSLLYSAVVRIRRYAYRRGWLQVWRCPVPVIMVGNITVGGTGKTPFVVWLSNRLKTLGFRVGVVSRGYGGASGSEPVAVRADTDPAICGDEPVVLARQCQCPVMVHSQRAQAVRALLAASDCDLIVADDGMQHYALARDIEIAIIDGVRRFGNGMALPAGPLREPRTRLGSVDLLVCNGGRAGAGEFEMTLSGATAISIPQPHQRRAVSSFRPRQVHAVAGIGHPERFFDLLRAHGLQLEPHVFADHHRFSERDLRFGDDRPVLMTEKDAVKCERWAAANHWYVPVQAVVSENLESAIVDLLTDRLAAVGGRQLPSNRAL